MAATATAATAVLSAQSSVATLRVDAAHAVPDLRVSDIAAGTDAAGRLRLARASWRRAVSDLHWQWRLHGGATAPEKDPAGYIDPHTESLASRAVAAARAERLATEVVVAKLCDDGEATETLCFALASEDDTGNEEDSPLELSRQVILLERALLLSEERVRELSTKLRKATPADTDYDSNDNSNNNNNNNNNNNKGTLQNTVGIRYSKAPLSPAVSPEETPVNSPEKPMNASNSPTLQLTLLQKQLSALTETLESSNRHAAAQKQKLDQLNHSLNESDVTIKQLQDEKRDLIDKHTTEIRELKADKLDSTNQHITAIKSLQKKLDSAESEVATLRNAIDEWQLRFNECAISRENALDALAVRETDLHECRQSLEALQTEKQNLETSVAEMSAQACAAERARNIEFSKFAQQLEDVESKAKEQIDELNARVANLTRDNDSFVAQIEGLESLNQAQADNISRLAADRARLVALADEFEARATILEVDLESARSECESLSGKLLEKNQYFNELQSKCKIAEAKSDEANLLYKSLQSELQLKEKALDDLVFRVGVLESAVKTKTDLYEELKIQYEQSKLDIATAIESKSIMSKLLEESTNELVRSREGSETFTKEIDALCCVKNELQAALESKLVDLAECQNRVGCLGSELRNSSLLRERLEKDLESSNDRVTALEEQLVACKNEEKQLRLVMDALEQELKKKECELNQLKEHNAELEKSRQDGFLIAAKEAELAEFQMRSQKLEESMKKQNEMLGTIAVAHSELAQFCVPSVSLGVFNGNSDPETYPFDRSKSSNICIDERVNAVGTDNEPSHTTVETVDLLNKAIAFIDPNDSTLQESEEHSVSDDEGKPKTTYALPETVEELQRQHFEKEMELYSQLLTIQRSSIASIDALRSKLQTEVAESAAMRVTIKTMQTDGAAKDAEITRLTQLQVELRAKACAARDRLLSTLASLQQADGTALCPYCQLLKDRVMKLERELDEERLMNATDKSEFLRELESLC
ncbi:hypothetical protein HDU83_008399 [Entophlyctis luteolus]|nr:hypothetical protein HDU83_008399 [Entophlyctis luteolus]